MASDRGASIWLSREEWGNVIDGLVTEVERATRRKAVNSESTSDDRVKDIEALIARLYAALAAQGGAGLPCDVCGYDGTADIHVCAEVLR
jgi:hypothetical protein